MIICSAYVFGLVWLEPFDVVRRGLALDVVTDERKFYFVALDERRAVDADGEKDVLSLSRDDDKPISFQRAGMSNNRITFRIPFPDRLYAPEDRRMGA